MWREDSVCQALPVAAVSFGCTALFSLYNGYPRLRYGSVWHESIGIFCLLLMVIRGMVLLTENRNRARLEAVQNRCPRRDLCGYCGHHCGDAAKGTETIRHPHLGETNIKFPMLYYSLNKHSMGNLLLWAAHQA